MNDSFTAISGSGNVIYPDLDKFNGFGYSRTDSNETYRYISDAKIEFEIEGCRYSGIIGPTLMNYSGGVEDNTANLQFATLLINNSSCDDISSGTAGLITGYKSEFGFHSVAIHMTTDNKYAEVQYDISG